MPLVLPPLPKLLDVAGIRELEQLARRTGEWARAAQDLLRGLRQESSDLDSRISELESNPTGGGGSVSLGPVTGLTVGGANVNGVAVTASHSDHVHSLPAFGTGAGTFCQGNDSRLSDARAPTAHHTSHEAGGSDGIKLDDLVAPDDNTDLNVSTSAHGLMVKLPNDSSKIFDGVGVWRKPLLARVWDARAVPSGLHADSDEFDAGSLAGSWNDFDHGAWLTNSVESNPGQLVIAGTHAADATARLGGVYKAVPSTEFQFLAHCALDCDMGGSSTATAIVALAIMQDAASATGDLITCHRSISNPDANAVNTVAKGIWTAYNAISSAVSFNTQYNTMWLRMRISIAGAVTTYATDWSSDGVHWVTVGTGGGTTGYAALHYGLVGGSAISGRVVRVTAQHFRVFSGAGSSAFNYVNNGNYLGS